MMAITKKKKPGEGLSQFPAATVALPTPAQPAPKQTGAWPGPNQQSMAPAAPKKQQDLRPSVSKTPLEKAATPQHVEVLKSGNLMVNGQLIDKETWARYVDAQKYGYNLPGTGAATAGGILNQARMTGAAQRTMQGMGTGQDIQRLQANPALAPPPEPEMQPTGLQTDIPEMAANPNIANVLKFENKELAGWNKGAEAGAAMKEMYGTILQRATTDLVKGKYGSAAGRIVGGIFNGKRAYVSAQKDISMDSVGNAADLIQNVINRARQGMPPEVVATEWKTALNELGKAESNLKILTELDEKYFQGEGRELEYELRKIRDNIGSYEQELNNAMLEGKSSGKTAYVEGLR